MFFTVRAWHFRVKIGFDTLLRLRFDQARRVVWIGMNRKAVRMEIWSFQTSFGMLLTPLAETK